MVLRGCSTTTLEWDEPQLAEAMRQLGWHNATIDLAVNDFSWFQEALRRNPETLSVYGKAYVERFGDLLGERKKNKERGSRWRWTAEI